MRCISHTKLLSAALCSDLEVPPACFVASRRDLKNTDTQSLHHCMDPKHLVPHEVRGPVCARGIFLMQQGLLSPSPAWLTVCRVFSCTSLLCLQLCPRTVNTGGWAGKTRLRLSLREELCSWAVTLQSTT